MDNVVFAILLLNRRITLMARQSLVLTRSLNEVRAIMTPEFDMVIYMDGSIVLWSKIGYGNLSRYYVCRVTSSTLEQQVAQLKELYDRYYYDGWWMFRNIPFDRMRQQLVSFRLLYSRSIQRGSISAVPQGVASLL
jgi:hypothetical protein